MPKFVDIPTAAGDDTIPINPEHVSMLLRVRINNPNGLTEADGKTPMSTTGTGIVLSCGQTIPVAMSRKAVQQLLENGGKISNLKIIEDDPEDKA